MIRIDFKAFDASVKGYLHEDHNELVAHKVRPALLVVSGGAYRFISPREADDPGFMFFAIGYNVFTIDYSIMEKASEYRPIKELAKTVSLMRENSVEWGIDSNRIAVMGFSAGGHLAASLGVLHDQKALELAENCRPDALILGYPVISMYEHYHVESMHHVTGDDEKVREMLSLERHIGPQVPPTFLWHTMEDASVPVENSITFASMLHDAGVDCECHLFAHGPHGESICTQEVESYYPANAAWVELCKTWLNNLFKYIP